MIIGDVILTKQHKSTEDNLMYFVAKEGIIISILFHICTSEEEAIGIAKLGAENDSDSYHTWRVYKYVPVSNTDAYQDTSGCLHEEVFSTDKLIQQQRSE